MDVVTHADLQALTFGKCLKRDDFLCDSCVSNSDRAEFQVLYFV